MTQELKKTELTSTHQALGARMVEFGGWYMPVQYSGILEEIATVRQHAGLFDLSHMGRVRIVGTDAIAFVDYIATNQVASMQPGQIRYSLLCDAKGYCIDDILIYREQGNSLYLVINAGNTQKDLRWMQEHASNFDIAIEDHTSSTSMLALQGPASQSILSQITDCDLQKIRYYFFTTATVANIPEVMLSRTGYTGEDGFEIYFPKKHSAYLWQACMTAGKSHGLKPVGLGARDTLRLEAGMPLYGHEINEHTNPLEAGLDWAVKFIDGKNFIGRSALESIKQQGCQRKLVGFHALDKRIPRQGYPIIKDQKEVGKICSGSPSPTLDVPIGTGYVPAAEAKIGSTDFSMLIRDKVYPLKIVSLPFYKRKK